MTKLIPILFVFLVSCAGRPPSLRPDIEYQRDLFFSVQYWDSKKKEWGEKSKFVGVAVIKKSERYRVELFAPGEVDMMTLSSCHREIKTPNPEKSGGWFQDKKYAFEFSADQLIELDKPCAINLGVYEKERGRHGWAMMAIEHKDANLSAQTRCNGEIKMNGGTSFCQAKESLVQMISFDRPVMTTFYGNCVLKTPLDGKVWEYIMPRGKCILHFFDAKDERVEHIHYLFGYDSIPIRGVE